MINPYYEEKNIQIYCGDCLEIMPHLPKVDLVLTDPPYGVGKAKWDDHFPSFETWKMINKTMKNDASILVFPGEANIPNKLNILFSIWQYQWVIVWYKSNAMQFGKTGYAKQNLIWWLSKSKIIKQGPKETMLLMFQ